jgi:cytochrome c-type biogenesis protein CcmH
MSAPFWFLAGLLTGVTATSIAVPLLREVPRTGARALVYVGGGIAVFTVVAVGLYFVLGSPRQTPTSEAALAHPGANLSTAGSTPLSMEEATAQLQARLDQGGGSANDWQLLAQSYEFLGRKDDAKRAREHVTIATTATQSGETTRDAQGWANYADTLGTRSGSLAGEPAAAIDKALALDPINSKALWLKASLAHEQHRYSDALGLWRKLRSVLPADSSDIALVDANIAEAARLAGNPTSPEPSDRPATAQAAAAGISGTVSVDNSVAARVPRGATLFIYAKAADSPGPPLAVLRTTADTWPVSFQLDDSMAMMPSRRLSQFQKVVVEARLSRSGQATPAAGDLYVTSDVLSPSAGKKVTLIIKKEIG